MTMMKDVTDDDGDHDYADVISISPFPPPPSPPLNLFVGCESIHVNPPLPLWKCTNGCEPINLDRPTPPPKSCDRINKSLLVRRGLGYCNSVPDSRIMQSLMFLLSVLQDAKHGNLNNCRYVPGSRNMFFVVLEEMASHRRRCCGWPICPAWYISCCNPIVSHDSRSALKASACRPGGWRQRMCDLPSHKDVCGVRAPWF